MGHKKKLTNLKNKNTIIKKMQTFSFKRLL